MDEFLANCKSLVILNLKKLVGEKVLLNIKSFIESFGFSDKKSANRDFVFKRKFRAIFFPFLKRFFEVC